MSLQKKENPLGAWVGCLWGLAIVAVLAVVGILITSGCKTTEPEQARESLLLQPQETSVWFLAQDVFIMCTTLDVEHQAACYSFVGAVDDTIKLSSGKRSYCVDLTVQQQVKAFVDYLSKYPEELQAPAVQVLHWSVKQAHPCLAL